MAAAASEAPEPPFARGPVLGIAAVVGVTLLLLSGRYGYHRDELYFLEAGRHLAWGYPDQPPLTPLLARLADLVAPGSLVVLRLPSTLSAATVVVLGSLIARDLGARRSGQLVAAAATALMGFVLAMGHLLSTATTAFLGGALLTYLLQRLLRGRGGTRTWLLAGMVAGVTMQANMVTLGILAAFGIAVLLVGPRELFKQPGPYLALGIALLVVAPYLVWQGQHGWPQMEVARGIADGDSGTSEPRSLLIPFQVLQVGPWLAPFWIVGLVRLLRDQQLRTLGATYLVLLVLVLVLGGKPYYLSALYPLLIAAGAQPLLDRVRRWVVPALLVLSTPVIVFGLPVLPVRDANVVVAINDDVGETIGWPDLVDQVAVVHRTLPPGSAILAGNYGLAGAVDRYGPDRGLPPAYSGHNGYAAWGPPPAGTWTVLAVGIDPERLGRAFTSVEPAGELHNRWGIDNDEDGTRLYVCSGPRSTWAELWPEFTRVG